MIEPILAGSDQASCSAEDLAYVRDLGLVAQNAGGPPRVANPIYAEVVPRHLNYAVQETLPQQMGWCADAAENLDVAGLIEAFQTFSGSTPNTGCSASSSTKAGPQLLLQAHLQRIVNGAGRIERAYALGGGRTDLLIVWPQGGRERRWVVECKVRRGDVERAIADGIEQTGAYVDRCAAEAAHLIVFDRSPARSWEEKIFRRTAPPRR